MGESPSKVGWSKDYLIFSWDSLVPASSSLLRDPVVHHSPAHHAGDPGFNFPAGIHFIFLMHESFKFYHWMQITPKIVFEMWNDHELAREDFFYLLMLPGDKCLCTWALIEREKHLACWIPCLKALLRLINSNKMSSAHTSSDYLHHYVIHICRHYMPF